MSRRTTGQDDDYPDGRLYYWKSVNTPELSDKLIERLTQHTAAAPSPDSTIDVWYQGGAMARVGEQATAFANRGVPYLFGIEGNWDRQAGHERLSAVKTKYDPGNLFRLNANIQPTS